MTVLELTLAPTTNPQLEGYVSEADYWANYYHDGEICYEWNNGVLEEKPVSDFAGSLMYLWFVKLLDHFLNRYPLADVTMLDLGFELKLGYQKTIRRPDLGVIRRDNPNRMAADDRTYHGTFDLCVESLSDSTPREIERDTINKKKEYAGAGVQEYYILDNKARYTAFFARNALGIYQPIQPIHGVIHSGVLPGFRFRVADLYRQPSFIELTNDKIYQDFVLSEYQAEKMRAETEKIRAEVEKARAEVEKARAEAAQANALTEKVRAEAAQANALTEKARAEAAQANALTEKARAEAALAKTERLAAKLRELGISPDEI